MAIVIAMRITGILKEIFPLQLYEFCPGNSRSFRRILWILLGVGRLTSNKLFDFGADPDPEIFIGNFTTVE